MMVRRVILHCLIATWLIAGAGSVGAHDSHTPIVCINEIDTESDMERLVKQTLMKRLQKGGYTVFMIHAATDASTTDKIQLSLDNCESQQQLSALAKEYLHSAQSSLSALKIHFAPVLSSPYCRATETAQLLVNQEYEVAPLLQIVLMSPRHERELAENYLLRTLNSPPSEGANVLAISHLSNLLQAISDQDARPGDMLIFKPMPDTAHPKYLGTISLTDWETLAPTVLEEAKHAH